MEKRKIYIFFASALTTIGGGEMYVAGKAKYLKKLGWKIYACTFMKLGKKALIPAINECIELTEGWYFLKTPPYRFKPQEQDYLIESIIKKLNLNNCNDDEIIIESIPSYASATALWCELIAARIGARHFFSVLEEQYRYLENWYEDNLDFFYFKWKRNELIADAGLLCKLFNGYKNVTAPLREIPPHIYEQDAVDDVDFPKINNIARLDWNICHVGKAGKVYVQYVIESFGELAIRHPDKKINFIFVGEMDERLEMINRLLGNLPNVQLTFLGFLVPIPRILFSKVDVACAISQTAMFIAEENVKTIVGTSLDYKKSAGVLGYDTTDQLIGKPMFTYLEALENVLVKRLYENKKSNLIKHLPAEHYYENFWTILKNADPKKEYYVERLSQDRVRHWVSVFPFNQIARGTRVILFGATEISADYRRQIKTQQLNNPRNRFCMYSADIYNNPVEIDPDGIKELSDEPYCKILATVDEHPENFDDTVVGLDRLKIIDYDAILITAYSWQAKDAVKKILEIVPQMADRIICNLQFIDVFLLKHKELVYFDN